MSLLRKLRRQADDKKINSIALETLERRVLLNADLVIDAFDIDSPAAPPVLWGDSLTLATDIANIGDVDAGAFDSEVARLGEAVEVPPVSAYGPRLGDQVTI